jgi:hypothetical protein
MDPLLDTQQPASAVLRTDEPFAVVPADARAAELAGDALAAY